MDVTLAAVRREYATPSSLWLEVVLVGAGSLAALETARLAADAGPAAAIGAGIAVLAGSALAARAAGRALRRASLGAELWRKFGLDQELLAACAALTPVSAEDEAKINGLLSDLRGLAAMSNHLDQPPPEAPDLTAMVGLAERAVTRCLERWPSQPTLFTVTAAAVATANHAVRECLAANRHGLDALAAGAHLREAADALQAATLRTPD